MINLPLNIMVWSNIHINLQTISIGMMWYQIAHMNGSKNFFYTYIFY